MPPAARGVGDLCEVAGAPLAPARVLAGVLDHLGVPPEEWFPGVDDVEFT